jgi:phage-related protein
MKWRVDLAGRRVEKELRALSAGLQADFLRRAQLLEEFGLALGMPHVRPLGDKLFELRIRAKSGQARGVFVAAKDSRLIVVRIFQKKTRTTPRSEIRLARQRAARFLN